MVAEGSRSHRGCLGGVGSGRCFVGERRWGELRANFSRDCGSVLALFALRYETNTPSCFDSCGARGATPTSLDASVPVVTNGRKAGSGPSHPT